MKMNSRMVRNGLLWMIVGVLAILLLFNVFQPGDNRTNSVALSQIVDQVKAGNVKAVIVQDNNLRVQLRNGTEQFSRKEDGVSFTETMNGTLAIAPPGEGPISFTLTIASDDLHAMLTDQSHVAMMLGTVTCPALSAQPLSVNDGRFNLFINDPARVGTRLMVYRMVLRSIEGKDFYFHGVKTITDSPAIDAWAQTTILSTCSSVSCSWRTSA